MKARKKKTKAKKELGGFRYYRSEEQILAYQKVSAEKKLCWLEEMWKFNATVRKDNPHIAEIQDKFRRGEI